MFTRGYLLSIGTVDVTRMPPAWALTSDIMRFDEACPFAAVDASKSGSHITIFEATPKSSVNHMKCGFA